MVRFVAEGRFGATTVEHTDRGCLMLTSDAEFDLLSTRDRLALISVISNLVSALGLSNREFLSRDEDCGEMLDGDEGPPNLVCDAGPAGHPGLHHDSESSHPGW